MSDQLQDENNIVEEGNQEESNFAEDTSSADAEPEAVEGEEVEEAAPPKSRKNFRQHSYDLQQANYAMSNENAYLRSQLEHIEKEKAAIQAQAEASTKTALNHYELATQKRLEMAKAQQKQAIESGDVDGQSEASLELSLAANEWQNVINLKAQEKMYAQQAAQQPQSAPANQEAPSPQSYATQRWLEENASWMHPGSGEYDEDLAMKVDYAEKQYAQLLQGMGKGHLIRTPEYFHEVDKYIQKERSMNNTHPEYRRNLQVNRASHGGAPRSVPGREKMVSNQPAYAPLTEAQKEVAKIFNKSEKEYQKILHEFNADEKRKRGFL